MTQPSFYIVPECEGLRYPIRHRPVIQGYGDWPFRRAEELGDASNEARAGRASHGAAARLHHPATIAIAARP